MTTLADLLKPEHVQLHPRATSRDAAIQEIAGLLENDVQVLDWKELHRSVKASAPCIVEEGAQFCLCIPHARTAAVTEMVMSVGRFARGLLSFLRSIHARLLSLLKSSLAGMSSSFERLVVEIYSMCQ